jgi:hypothetical protein
MKMNGYSIQKLTGIIIAWYILHIIAAHLYTKLCVPLTLWGMALAPFMTTASHCILLRWTITHGGHATMIAWGMVSVWLSKFIFD